MFPFVLLLNLGIFHFLEWIGWLKDLLPSQQAPDGSHGISAQGLSWRLFRGQADGKLSLSWMGREAGGNVWFCFSFMLLYA